MGTDKLQLKRLAYSLHFIVQFAPFVRSETLSFVTTAVIEIMGARRHGQEGALALPWKMYTVSQKKYTPGCLAITLANVDQFSKFFHQVIRREILYLHTQRFPPHLQYIATLPCEIRKSKKVTKFSCWTWQLICLIKICCEILCNLPQKYCTNDFTYISVQHTSSRRNDINDGMVRTIPSLMSFRRELKSTLFNISFSGSDM